MTPYFIFWLSGNAIAVVSGDYHACALLSSGNITCAGPTSAKCQLGRGNTTALSLSFSTSLLLPGLLIWRWFQIWRPYCVFIEHEALARNIFGLLLTEMRCNICCLFWYVFLSWALLQVPLCPSQLETYTHARFWKMGDCSAGARTHMVKLALEIRLICVCPLLFIWIQVLFKVCPLYTDSSCRKHCTKSSFENLLKYHRSEIVCW